MREGSKLQPHLSRIRRVRAGPQPDYRRSGVAKRSPKSRLCGLLIQTINVVNGTTPPLRALIGTMRMARVSSYSPSATPAGERACDTFAMPTDLTTIEDALAGLIDIELHALIVATNEVPQTATGLLAWIEGACD